MVSKTISLSSLGWNFFWDKECTNPIRDTDVIPVYAGSTLDVFFGCVPELGSDGKVTRTRIISNETMFVMDYTYVIERESRVLLMGTDTDSTNGIGSIEEIIIQAGEVDIDFIREYGSSKNSVFGAEGENIISSSFDAYSRGIVQAYDFSETTNHQKDMFGSGSVATVNGDVFQIQGLVKPAMVIDENKENVTVESVRLGYSFGITVRFHVEIGRSFTIIKVPNCIELKYNYSNREMYIEIEDYMTEEKFSYKSEKIDHLFGKTSDVSVYINETYGYVFLDGVEIISFNIPFILNGINEYERANDILEFSGPLFKATRGTSSKDTYYNRSKNVVRLIENGTNPSFSYSDTSKIGDYEPDYYHRVKYNFSTGKAEETSRYYDVTTGFELIPDSPVILRCKFKDNISEGRFKISPFVYVDLDDTLLVKEEILELNV